MAYDEELAHRVREQLVDAEDLSEVAMFGGIAFLSNGNMALAVSSRGGLLVRVGADAAEAALSRPHATPFEMRGRGVVGWVWVDPEGLRSTRALAVWVRRGLSFARSLPPKRGRPRR